MGIAGSHKFYFAIRIQGLFGHDIWLANNLCTSMAASQVSRSLEIVTIKFSYEKLEFPLALHGRIITPTTVNNQSVCFLRREKRIISG
jgi:hypothetical protein